MRLARRSNARATRRDACRHHKGTNSITSAGACSEAAAMASPGASHRKRNVDNRAPKRRPRSRAYPIT